MKIDKKSAFTLAELIVVITVLAILGVIAFVSLSSYTADSRNSKRVSDLSSIQSAIVLKIGEGIPLYSIVIPALSKQVIGLSIAGTGTTQGDYTAGYIKYATLGINGNEFRDPKGNEYNIGITYKNYGRYELAATMEEAGSDRVAKIEGTYFPRKSGDVIDGIIVTSSVDQKNFTIKNQAKSNSFNVGDIINIDGNIYRVDKVVGGSTILLDKKINVPTGTELIAKLNAVESDGLIASVKGTDVANIVLDGGKKLPYNY